MTKSNDTPNQQELDDLERNIERTRHQIEQDVLMPSADEAEEQRERGEDLMPRTNSGNPM